MIRGGRSEKTAAATPQRVYWTPTTSARAVERTADPDADVISIIDGWIRVLERQARSIGR